MNNLNLNQKHAADVKKKKNTKHTKTNYVGCLRCIIIISSLNCMCRTLWCDMYVYVYADEWCGVHVCICVYMCVHMGVVVCVYMRVYG